MQINVLNTKYTNKIINKLWFNYFPNSNLELMHQLNTHFQDLISITFTCFYVIRFQGIRRMRKKENILYSYYIMTSKMTNLMFPGKQSKEKANE